MSSGEVLLDAFSVGLPHSLIGSDGVFVSPGPLPELISRINNHQARTSTKHNPKAVMHHLESKMMNAQILLLQQPPITPAYMPITTAVADLDGSLSDPLDGESGNLLTR